MITGRPPRGLQNATVLFLTYSLQAAALIYLITETYRPLES